IDWRRFNVRPCPSLTIVINDAFLGTYYGDRSTASQVESVVFSFDYNRAELL
ncbi:16662_t:CDS:2, partial [Racocetra fulgida]